MSYYYKFLFENYLIERLIKNNHSVGRLINLLDDRLEQNLSEYNYEGKILKQIPNSKNRQIIDTIYFNINVLFIYNEKLKFPIRFKCRCSNHIKPNLDEATDVKVFVPNIKQYNNNQYLLSDNFHYILNDNTIESYVRTALFDIKQVIKYKINKIQEIINLCSEIIIDDYKTLSKDEFILEHPKFKKIYDNKIFKEIINYKNHEEIFKNKPKTNREILTLKNKTPN